MHAITAYLFTASSNFMEQWSDTASSSMQFFFLLLTAAAQINLLNKCNKSTNCFQLGEAFCFHAACWELLVRRVETKSQRKVFRGTNVPQTYTWLLFWQGERSHFHHSYCFFLLSNNNRASRFCVYLPGWVQFHGLLTKLDVLFPRWSQAKATRSALKTGMFPAATLS